MHDVVKIFLRDGREVTVLGKILTNEAVGVFVKATLPRDVRMGKNRN